MRWDSTLWAYVIPEAWACRGTTIKLLIGIERPLNKDSLWRKIILAYATKMDMAYLKTSNKPFIGIVKPLSKVMFPRSGR